MSHCGLHFGSKLMRYYRTRVIIPLWRTNVYENDLVNATKQSLQELGDSFSDGVGCTPNSDDFAASLNEQTLSFGAKI
jgi:hypothetical protein